MDALVIDLTHGGVKIAVGLKKLGKFDNIYAYDIYNTIKNEDSDLLSFHNIPILKNEVDLKNYLDNLVDLDILIVNPIHSPFNFYNILNNSKFNSGKISVENITSGKINIEKINSGKISVENITINHSNNANSTNINQNFNPQIDITEITHHKAIKLILNKWKNDIANKNIPVVEVTGVKGKTSVVSMLKEILLYQSPLVLSSLGACYYKKGKKLILKKNISITPASILETIDIAKKIDNPNCINIDDLIRIDESPNNSSDNLNYNIGYGACIFESSLGATGLGDVGVLTNLVENYPIAKNTSNARNAKKQVFDCDIVVIEKETLHNFYISDDISKDSLNNSFDNSFDFYNLHSSSGCYNKAILSKINTFSFNDNSANLVLDSVSYGLNNTRIKLIYKNILTNLGDRISGSLVIDTFAPGKHHVLNVLCAVTVSLSLGIDKDQIKRGLINFKGIKGRTSLKNYNNSIIIEEINPGINTKAIESSIKMIDSFDDYTIILGGKYGVTCEEIDENKVANLLDNFLNDSDYKLKNNSNKNSKKKLDLILTDDLGIEIEKKMLHSVEIIKNPIDAQKKVISNNKNILFIYRSNYSQINKR